jgi:hypothetical protein
VLKGLAAGGRVRIGSIPIGWIGQVGPIPVRPDVFFDNLVGTIVASIASVPTPRRKPTGR